MILGKNNKLKIIVTAVILTVAILFYFYFKYLPKVINLENRRTQIEEAIRENINLPINMGRLDTAVTWDLGVRIYISDFNIFHSDKKEFVSTGPVSIELSIPALIQKQVLIRKIEANSAVVHVVRLKNGDFDIEQLIPKSKKAKKYKVKFKNSSIILNGYQLYFQDSFITPSQTTSIIGKNIHISEFDPDKFIRIYANGTVISCKKPYTEFDVNVNIPLPLIKKNFLNKPFNIDGTVKNLSPGIYLNYINTCLDNKYADLSGLATFKFNINKDDKNLNIYNYKIEADIDELQGKKKSKGNVFTINEQSKIFLEGSIDNSKKQLLNLNRAELKSPKANVSIEGKIFNFRTKKRILDLKVKTENTRVESLVKIFPKEIKIPKDAFNKLYKHNAKGNITANLTIKGYYKVPLMNGNLKYSGFSLDETRKNIPGWNGKVDFKDYYIYLDTLTYINHKEYVKITGKISPLKFKTMDLNIKSTKIDLERGDQILLAVRDILNFKLGPVPLMNIKGRGDVSLKINGSFKEPNLNGYLNVQNGYMTYALLAKFGHDINGRLLFNNDRILYNNINGYVEDSKVTADGYSTLRLDSFSDVNLILPDVNLKGGHEFVFNSPLLIKLQQSLKAIDTANGRADGVINLKGTSTLLHSKGQFVLKNANIKYKGFCDYFQNITGVIDFNDQLVNFNKMKGFVAKTPVNAEGKVDNQILDMILTSDNVNLAESRKFIKNSPILIEAEKGMQDYLTISGTSKAKMHLYGNVNENKLFDYAKFYDYKASFFNRMYGYPVNATGSLVTFTIDGMFTDNMKLLTLDMPMTVSGKITGFKNKKPVPTLKVFIPRYDVTKTALLSKSNLMQKQVKDYLRKFDSLKGSFAANIDMFPDNSYIANIKLNDVQGRYLPWNASVLMKDGRLTVTPEKLVFDKVFVKASKTLINLNGSFYNYLFDPSMDINVAAKINSDDIKDYINPHFKNQVIASGIIPVSASIKGNAKKWDILSTLTLYRGANLSLQKDIQLPDDKIRTFNLDASGSKDKVDIKNMEIVVRESRYNKSASSNPNINEQIFNIKGVLNDIDTNNPSFEQFFIIASKPVDLALFNTAIKASETDNFFSEGKIKANILLNGKLFSPKILGNLSLYNVKVPSKQLSIESCDIVLDKSNISIVNGNINIDGSSATINALLSNVFDYPILIKDITVDSSSLDIDKISKMFNSKANTGKDITEDLPSVLVTNGILNAQELIISNLITNNVTSNFTFTPDWLLSLSNVSLNTAGGNATGEILYNIKSTDVSANIAVSNMQANAAASTFLKLPNEVYGTLNGKGEFNSKGKTSQELVANANGFASFNIEEGRLVRLGSLEYFLRAINIVQSGVADFNINNILDLIVPQNTGNFESLEGTLTVKDGAIRTDNLSSKGKELSLYLSGDLDMVTNNADVMILGNMSKKVSGLLGPVGSVSINTFIDFIPGIGFIPSNPDTGIINMIPGISRIPGLGLGGSKKTRRFQVKIKGNLYDPRSVKSFRWLD